VVHTGGLVDAASLKRENAIKKQKLKDDFAAMEDSGREAETTIRDKVCCTCAVPVLCLCCACALRGRCGDYAA